MYTQNTHYHNCNTKHISSKRDKWIALHQPQAWLYSVTAEQQITIKCNKRESKETIKNTGKIVIRDKCKLTTPDFTIQTNEITFETEIHTYLPEMNMTLLKNDNPLTHINDTREDVSQHKAELTELKSELEKINGQLQDNEQKFFAKKQFIYPMASSGIITLIVITIVIIYIFKNRKNKTKIVRRPSVRFCEENDPYKTYGFPRPIRRSLSTRF